MMIRRRKTMIIRQAKMTGVTFFTSLLLRSLKKLEKIKRFR